MSSTLTDRQIREREYFDEYIDRNMPHEVHFDSVDGRETRSWNPYWYVAQIIRERFTSPSQKLLDFGCGYGYYSVMFGHVGYEVFGFDVSEKNVSAAKHLASKYGLADRTHFRVGTAEKLEYPPTSFDVIVGVDILHHVEIEASIRECFRVLRPGGIAIFKEPVEVEVFDWLRNTAVAKRIFPKDKSFERCITEDERKLDKNDLSVIGSIFPVVGIKRFRLFARLDAFSRHLSSRPKFHIDMLRRLEKFDTRCFTFLPFLRPFGGEVVMVLRKD